jgi:hypothetical protein
MKRLLAAIVLGLACCGAGALTLQPYAGMDDPLGVWSLGYADNYDDSQVNPAYPGFFEGCPTPVQNECGILNEPPPPNSTAPRCLATLLKWKRYCKYAHNRKTDPSGFAHCLNEWECIVCGPVQKSHTIRLNLSPQC